MDTRKLGKNEWQAYFDRLSRHAKLTSVSMLVQGDDLGVQHELERAELTGITYDHADDALEIATPDMVHRVLGPREVWVREDADGAMTSLKITDAQGREQIVELEPRVEQREAG